MYEVQIIREVTDKFGTRFRNPSNNDWGTYGWTFYTLAQAQEKYMDYQLSPIASKTLQG